MASILFIFWLNKSTEETEMKIINFTKPRFWSVHGVSSERYPEKRSRKERGEKDLD